MFGNGHIGPESMVKENIATIKQNYYAAIGQNIAGGPAGAAGYLLGGDKGSFVGAAVDQIATSFGGIPGGGYLSKPESIIPETYTEVAAKGVTRSLDDLSSLRGATWKEAESLIPKGWTRGPLNKGEGIKFVNPAKKGEQILLEKGWPGAKDPLHSGPYMKVSRDGTVTRIPLQGNSTLK